jgi:hypothetical protein
MYYFERQKVPFASGLLKISKGKRKVGRWANSWNGGGDYGEGTFYIYIYIYGNIYEIFYFLKLI